MCFLCSRTAFSNRRLDAFFGIFCPTPYNLLSFQKYYFKLCYISKVFSLKLEFRLLQSYTPFLSNFGRHVYFRIVKEVKNLSISEVPARSYLHCRTNYNNNFKMAVEGRQSDNTEREFRGRPVNMEFSITSLMRGWWPRKQRCGGTRFLIDIQCAKCRKQHFKTVDTVAWRSILRFLVYRGLK